MLYWTCWSITAIQLTVVDLFEERKLFPEQKDSSINQKYIWLIYWFGIFKLIQAFIFTDTGQTLTPVGHQK